MGADTALIIHVVSIFAGSMQTFVLCQIQTRQVGAEKKDVRVGSRRWLCLRHNEIQVDMGAD